MRQQAATTPGHSPCQWTNSSLGITPVSDCAAASGSDDRGIRRAALACQPSPPRVELLRGPPSWVPPRRRCPLRRLPLPLPSPCLLRKVRLRLPLPRLRRPRSPAHRALRHRTPPHRLLPAPLRTPRPLQCRRKVPPPRPRRAPLLRLQLRRMALRPWRPPLHARPRPDRRPHLPPPDPPAQPPARRPLPHPRRRPNRPLARPFRAQLGPPALRLQGGPRLPRTLRQLRLRLLRTRPRLPRSFLLLRRLPRRPPHRRRPRPPRRPLLPLSEPPAQPPAPRPLPHPRRRPNRPLARPRPRIRLRLRPRQALPQCPRRILRPQTLLARLSSLPWRPRRRPWRPRLPRHPRPSQRPGHRSWRLPRSAPSRTPRRSIAIRTETSDGRPRSTDPSTHRSMCRAHRSRRGAHRSPGPTAASSADRRAPD